MEIDILCVVGLVHFYTPRNCINTKLKQSQHLKDNFPYGATTFSLFFTNRDRGLYQSGKLDNILFYFEWKSGGAIRKLFQTPD